VLLQLDDYFNDRNQPVGKVLSVGRGLCILLPDSRTFRRPVRVNRLDVTCAKCGEVLRSWPMRRSVNSDQAAVSFIECSCMIVAVEPDRYDVHQITAAWRSFRKLQNQVLSKLNQS
jgi:hypothetical protein